MQSMRTMLLANFSIWLLLVSGPLAVSHVLPSEVRLSDPASETVPDHCEASDCPLVPNRKVSRGTRRFGLAVCRDTAPLAAWNSRSGNWQRNQVVRSWDRGHLLPGHRLSNGLIAPLLT